MIVLARSLSISINSLWLSGAGRSPDVGFTLRDQITHRFPTEVEKIGAHQARRLPCSGMYTNLSPRRRHRLLVVDDDQDCADSLSQLIAISSDWEVEVACGSAQALLQAAVNPPDAIILDVALTGMDGFETADRLSQATGDGGPSIFVVTGNADLQDQAAHDTRFAASMMKPVDADKLLRLMAKFD